MVHVGNQFFPVLCAYTILSECSTAFIDFPHLSEIFAADVDNRVLMLLSMPRKVESAFLFSKIVAGGESISPGLVSQGMPAQVCRWAPRPNLRLWDG